MYADFHCYNCKYGPVIGIFIDRLPEAMCCWLQTYTVNDALLVMYCMCLLAVIVTSADIRKLWVYVCLLSFFCCTLHISSEEYIAWGYLLLFTHLLCLCHVVGSVLCMPTFIANMGQL